jgi:hypothetical protein
MGTLYRLAGTCIAFFGDRYFFGSTDGQIIECEVTGADQGAPYTATSFRLFDPLKSPASLKTGLQSRATIRAAIDINVRLSLQIDFEVTLPAAPDDSSIPEGSLWGTAKWGSSVWGR